MQGLLYQFQLKIFFQNGSHAWYVPLNFVICSFGSFAVLCSLWSAFSKRCCFALVSSSWRSNSIFISICSLSNLNSTSWARAFLSSSSFCFRYSIYSFVSTSHFSSRGTSSSASAIGSTMLLLQLPTSSALFPASNMVCSTLSLGPSTSFTNACRLSRCRATAPQFPFCTMPSVFPRRVQQHLQFSLCFFG